MYIFHGLDFIEKCYLKALLKANGFKYKDNNIIATKKLKNKALNYLINNEAFDILVQNKEYIDYLFDCYFSNKFKDNASNIIFNLLMGNTNRKETINYIMIQQVKRKPKIVRFLFDSNEEFSRDEQLRKAALDSYAEGLAEKIKNNDLTKEDVEILSSIKDEKEVTDITVRIAGIAYEYLDKAKNKNDNLKQLFDICNSNYKRQSEVKMAHEYETFMASLGYTIVHPELQEKFQSFVSGQYDKRIKDLEEENERLKSQNTNTNTNTNTTQVNTQSNQSYSESIQDKLHEREKELIEREKELIEREKKLIEREKELIERERALNEREMQLEARGQSLPKNTNLGEDSFDSETQKLIAEAQLLAEGALIQGMDMEEPQASTSYHR